MNFSIKLNILQTIGPDRIPDSVQADTREPYPRIVLLLNVWLQRMNLCGTCKFNLPQVYCCVFTLYLVQTCNEAPAAAGYLKHCGKRRNCSLLAVSSFAPMFSNFSHWVSIQLVIFYLLTQYVESRLLQVVCKRERVLK